MIACWTRLQLCKFSMLPNCTSVTIMHILHYAGSRTLLLSTQNQLKQACNQLVHGQSQHNERLKIVFNFHCETTQLVTHIDIRRRSQHSAVSHKQPCSSESAMYLNIRYRVQAVAEHEAADRKASPRLRLSRTTWVKQLQDQLR